MDFFNVQITDEIINEIFIALHEIGSVKWHLIPTVRLQQSIDGAEVQTLLGYFRFYPYPEHIVETVRDHLSENLGKFKTLFEEFVQLGSGWM